MTTYQWIAAGLRAAIPLNTARTNWLRGAMLLLCSNVLLVAAGCSTIDKRAGAPPDWPKLRVVVHKSGFMSKQQCDGAIGGCAVPDFCSRRCDVYLQINSTAIEAHERAHCAGYDHPGDDTMKALWANYRQRGGPAICSARLGISNYCALWPEDREQCTLRVSGR
jgi:hypothetical protein